VNPCFSVICNYEVMEALKNIKDTKKKYGLRNLATITYETLQYLEDSPCKHQTRETIIAFINEMQQYKLTTNECLMMVNDPPSSALHIQLLIEDSEERLTEEQVNNIIELTKKYFPGPPQETN
ncbi:hypothetical protein DOY81_010999, partial [Sarcophaga bullata]